MIVLVGMIFFEKFFVMQGTGLVVCVSSLQYKLTINQSITNSDFIHDYDDDGNDNGRQLKQKLLASVWSQLNYRER